MYPRGFVVSTRGRRSFERNANLLFVLLDMVTDHVPRISVNSVWNYVLESVRDKAGRVVIDVQTKSCC